MIDISIHSDGLELYEEFPSNHNCLKLRPIGEEAYITIFTTLDQWWKLRSIMPKSSSGYSMVCDHRVAVNPYARIHAYAAADAYAETFYKAELAKLTPTPIPPMTEAQTEAMLTGDFDAADQKHEAQMADLEPNDDVGATLRSLPVIGTLNVDTNTFTPASPPQMLPIVEEPESDQVLF